MKRDGSKPTLGMQKPRSIGPHRVIANEFAGLVRRLRRTCRVHLKRCPRLHIIFATDCYESVQAIGVEAQPGGSSLGWAPCSPTTRYSDTTRM